MTYNDTIVYLYIVYILHRLLVHSNTQTRRFDRLLLIVGFSCRQPQMIVPVAGRCFRSSGLCLASPHHRDGRVIKTALTEATGWRILWAERASTTDDPTSPSNAS